MIINIEKHNLRKKHLVLKYSRIIMAPGESNTIDLFIALENLINLFKSHKTKDSQKLKEW